MAGSAINWESLAREDAIGPIVSSGRYRLDSPSTVTGSPTFAMAAAGQSATIRVFLPSGQSVETPISVSGTTAVSLVNQVGKPFSQSELALIEIEVTMPYGENLLTTDEPNGSPSAPFATEADRTAWATANLATLLPGRTTAWGPGNVEYRFVGPGADVWEIISEENTFDLVVYGATMHGISAAIAAKKAGLSVVVLNPVTHVGGMVTGGIAATDYVAAIPWSTDLIPGLAGEFLKRIALKFYPRDSYYQSAKMRAFKLPLWASRSVLREMIQENDLQIINDAYLLRCETAEIVLGGVASRKITKIVTSRGVYICKAGAHDGTDEGDLIAAAGATHTIGRESAAQYGETGAGVVASQSFELVDPYVIPGDPSSGVLFGFETDIPPAVGAADTRIQSMQYRLSFSSTAAHHQIEPDNYDTSKYEYFGRKAAAYGSGWESIDDVLTLYNLATGGISDINQKGEFSLGWVGPESTEWITATKERRAEIEYTIKQWTLGLLKFMKTDERIPEAVRLSVASYGFVDADHIETGGFPPFIYCREGRRLVGDFVLTANHMRAQDSFTDPAAFAYYAFDSHFVRRYVEAGVPKAEGYMLSDTAVIGGRVPMRVCLPKAVDCVNLTASAALSVTHLAYLSLRMEPIRIAVAEFAGAIHAIAHAKNKPVQHVTWEEAAPLTGLGAMYPKNEGDVLVCVDGLYGAGLASVIEKTGDTWPLVASARYAQISRYAASAVAGATLRVTPQIQKTGTYTVYIQFPVIPGYLAANRPSEVPVKISTPQGVVDLTVNQTPTNQSDGGAWVELGAYTFRKATTYNTGATTDRSPDWIEFGTDGSGVNATWITAVAFKAS